MKNASAPVARLHLVSKGLYRRTDNGKHRDHDCPGIDGLRSERKGRGYAV